MDLNVTPICLAFGWSNIYSLGTYPRTLNLKINEHIQSLLEFITFLHHHDHAMLSSHTVLYHDNVKYMIVPLTAATASLCTRLVLSEVSVDLYNIV